MKEEQIIADYQRKRRLLEEEEDILKNTQRKGEQLIQETLSDIYRIVQQSAENREPFDQARQSIAQLENEYHEKIAKAKKQIYQQQNELERTINLIIVVYRPLEYCLYKVY
jgi:phosphate uptake regulator